LEHLTTYSEIALGASQYLPLNHRFYTLLRPMWFSALNHWRLRSNETLARALQHPLICTYLETVSIRIDGSTDCQTEFSSLCRLPHLRSITITLSEGSDVLAEVLLRPLGNIANLRELRISAETPHKINFSSFALAETAPLLTTLRLPFRGGDYVWGAPNQLPHRLKRLELLVSKSKKPASFDWRSIPWQTIEELAICSTISLNHKSSLSDSLTTALYPSSVSRLSQSRSNRASI